MKEKIVERLKAKAKDSGVNNLTQKRLDTIADRLSKKITTEEEIDGKIDEFNDLYPLAEIAKEDDRVRTLEAKAKGKPKPEPEETDDEAENDEPEQKPKPKPKKKDDEAPAWAKGLIEKVNALEKEKFEKSISEKITAKLKEKKLPSYLSKLIKVEKEEDLEEVINQVEADHLAEEQAANDEALGKSKQPAGGKGKTVAPTKEEIDKILV